MTKSDLIDTVFQQLGDAAVAKATVERCVSTALEAIAEGLKKDQSVALLGFGTFTLQHKPARPGRNPKTGEAITIEASTKVKFKAGKGLMEKVR